MLIFTTVFLSFTMVVSPNDPYGEPKNRDNTTRKWWLPFVKVSVKRSKGYSNPMQFKNSLWWPIIALSLSGYVHAQPWTGIIAPNRAIDWRGTGTAIPTNYTVCSSADAGTTVPIPAYGSAGSPGSPSTINNALAACHTAHTGGAILMLGAGTFYLNSSITYAGKSNLILRGQGADQTQILFYGHGGCNWPSHVCIEGSNTYSGGGYTQADWTGGYTQGGTSITLSKVTGIVVNVTPIVLDQCDDGFTGSTGTETCTGSASVGPDVTYCQTVGVCSAQTGANITRPNRAEGETVVATAINGSGPYTVTINKPLMHANWGTNSKWPEAWWGSSTIQGSGIESLAIDGTNDGGSRGSSGYYGISLDTSLNCWVKGIRSSVMTNYHVQNNVSFGNVIRDSYFYFSYNGGTESYGVGGALSGGILIENNIMQGITDPVNFDGPCSYCVASYNFALNQWFQLSYAYLLGSLALHGAGTDYILFEGNIGDFPDNDDVHGTHNLETYYRNYFNGFEPNDGHTPTNNTVGFHLAAFSREFNVIGNVLGSKQYHTAYQCSEAANGSPCNHQYKDVFDLGYSSNNYGETDPGGSPNDPLAATTLMRWGNWDVISNAIRWCGNSSDSGWTTTCGSTSEVPTSLSTYANSVPTLGDTGIGQGALPTSFYLSGIPSWWNFPNGTTAPFPGIGPDVAGGNILKCAGGTYANTDVLSNSQCTGTGSSTSNTTAGHAYANPAMNCYFNVMAGQPDGSNSSPTTTSSLTAYIFNANNCYYTGTTVTVNPPSVVSAVIH
jgi:hypothetical protein